MELVVHRKYKKRGYSIGKLYVDGKYFCDTLEDEDRELYDWMQVEDIKRIKQFGETAIPFGTYKVRITYSPKFKRDLPLIEGVMGFDGIRIHSGNTAKDTLGCLLVGKNTQVGMVTQSRDTFNRLFALLKGEENITITFK